MSTLSLLFLPYRPTSAYPNTEFICKIPEKWLFLTCRPPLTGGAGANIRFRMSQNERFYFLGLQNNAEGDCSHEIRRDLFLGRKAMTILDSRDITLPTKICIVKAMFFPIVRYGWMWELDHKKGWALKNRCFWTVVLEKTLECPLDCKEIQQVNPKGNQPWMFTGRTDAEAPILWSPDEKIWLIAKDPDAGKDWRKKERRVAEDEMVR